MHTIIPSPNGTAALHKNRIAMPEQFSVQFGSFDPFCIEAFLERTGSSLSEGKPWITLKSDSDLDKEAYRIHISGTGMVIYAKEEEGLSARLKMHRNTVGAHKVSTVYVTFSRSIP